MTTGLLLTTVALLQQAAEPQSIPFELTSHNNIAVRVLINERDQAMLMFHLAVDSVSLTQKASRRIGSVSFDKNARLSSWGGQSAPVLYSSRNTLQIRGQTWKDVGITESRHSGPGTDGKFGPNLFGGRIVEIDFDRGRLVIHPSLPEHAANYERLDIETRSGSMFAKATVGIGGELVQNDFMIHTGFGGGVLFDDAFAARHRLVSTLKVVGGRELKDSMGNVLKTTKLQIPSLRLGSFSLAGLPAEVFPGAIQSQKMSVLGADVWKRFNMLIDTGAGHLYLKPNNLRHLPYSQ